MGGRVPGTVVQASKGGHAQEAPLGPQAAEKVGDVLATAGVAGDCPELRPFFQACPSRPLTGGWARALPSVRRPAWKGGRKDRGMLGGEAGPGLGDLVWPVGAASRGEPQLEYP